MQIVKLGVEATQATQGVLNLLTTQCRMREKNHFFSTCAHACVHVVMCSV